jgi:uncharacterized RDD family membrane protein YckC/Flp pilus assembly protein TadD
MSNNLISPLTSVTNPVPTSTPQPFIFASFKRRLVAYLIDLMFIFISQQIVFEILGLGSFSKVMSAQTVAQLSTVQQPTTQLGIFVVSSIISFAYYAFYYVSREGATPGKKILGIKLVRADGAPVTYGVVLGRFLMSIISGLCLSLGYIWAAFDQKHQTWHDKVANTYVVNSGLPARKGLGIFLAIIFLVIYGVYISAVYIKAFSVGFSEGFKNKYAESHSTTTNTQKKTMSPEVDKIVKSANSEFALIRNAEDAGTRQNAVNALVAELKDAVSTYPNESQLWTQLASAYTWSNYAGSLDSAVAAIKKSIEVDPENATAYYTLGQIYVNQGKYSEAVIELKKSLRLNEDSPYAHLTLADAYNNLGIAEDARAEYKMAISKFEKINENGGHDADILRAKKSMSTLK